MWKKIHGTGIFVPKKKIPVPGIFIKKKILGTRIYRELDWYIFIFVEEEESEPAVDDIDSLYAAWTTKFEALKRKFGWKGIIA